MVEKFKTFQMKQRGLGTGKWRSVEQQIRPHKTWTMLAVSESDEATLTGKS